MARDKDTNIVIQQLTDAFKLVPGKDGRTLQRVEESYEATFRAIRVGGKAYGLAHYNDDVKIGRVSGGDTHYGSYFSDDVFFSDSKACIIKVELKKAGATGKASFNRTFTKPEFFCKVILAESYDIENATVSFQIPASLTGKFTIEERNMPAGKMTRSSVKKGDSEIITYNFTDIVSPKYFDDSPSLNITAPQFIIRGHFDDVNELYRYLAGYVPEDDPGAGAVAEKARQITEDCRDDSERIVAVTDFVHNAIRYVAVEHGEFGQRPDFASEVLRKAYGDCKGSAALIKGMLKALGIDARLAWVGTSAIGERWTDVPNVSSGDHMIAAVVSPDSITFIDGTARYCSAGQLPGGIQGAQALIEDGPEKCIVATIPVLPPQYNMRRDDISLEITPDGKLSSYGSITFTGGQAHAVRGIIDGVPSNQRDRMRDMIFASAVSGSLTDESELTAAGDSVIISGRATTASAVKIAGGEIYVDMNPFSRLADMRFDTDGRTTGGSIGMRSAYDCTFSLLLPEGMEAVDLPADVQVDSEWITSSVSTRLSDDGRRVVRSFSLTINKPDVDVDSLKHYNSEINRINRACTSKIVLKKL